MVARPGVAHGIASDYWDTQLLQLSTLRVEVADFYHLTT
jgi:hypothetical protein